MKATHGLIPSHGMTHLDHTIDFICPLASSVEDVARLLGVLAGEDWRDPQWVRGEIKTANYLRGLQESQATFDGVTAGVVRESIREDKCEPDVLANLRASCDILEEAGITVREVSIPIWEYGLPITQAIVCHLAGQMVKSEGMGYGHIGLVDVDGIHAYALRRRAQSHLLPPYVKVWMIVERFLHEEYFNVPYALLQNLRIRLRREIDDAFSESDILITPTTPTTAPPLLSGNVDAESVINRILQLTPYNTSPLNLSGHPALAVPNGTDRAGMPTSAQIVARRFDETLALRAGKVIEEHVATTSTQPSAEREKAPL
jgi:amidase